MRTVSDSGFRFNQPSEERRSRRTRSMSTTPKKPNLTLLRKTQPRAFSGNLSRSQRYRLEEANRRVHVLRFYGKLLAEGLSGVQAARELGMARTTLWRYLSRSRHGYTGLLPRTDRCGRKPMFPRKPLRMKTPPPLVVLVKLGSRIIARATVTLKDAQRNELALKA